MASSSLGAFADQSAVREMVADTGSGISKFSQMPLDVRIAEFLAGLDGCISSTAASLKKSSSDTVAELRVKAGDPSSTAAGSPLVSEGRGGWSWDCRKDGHNDAGSFFSSALAASKETSLGKKQGESLKFRPKSDCMNHTMSSTANAASTDGDGVSRKFPRRRRYRNEQQKLSNSLAQKRYRQRKKQAFERMQAVVDQLSAEVKSLQGVRAENERLLAGLGPGVRHRQSHPQASILNGHEPPVVLSAPGLMSDDGLIPCQNRVNQAGCKGKDIMDGNGCCNDKSSVALPANVILCKTDLAGLTSGDSVDVLENEWNRGLSSLEKVVNHGVFEQGTSSQDKQEFLGTIVNSLFTISSRVMYTKIQLIIEENRSNSQRISELLQGYLSE